MYIQISTRCNYACDHCCFSCGKKGSDMSMAIFRKALALASDDGDTVILGGGEPTLHPNFWEMLGLALGNSSDEGGVWLATNGTVTDTAVRLANMARKGILGVCLSRTQWHREQRIQPDARVLRAFEGVGKRTFDANRDDMREIREMTGERGTPFAVGRAAEWGVEGCCCDGIHVDPDGTIFECGCRLVSMGTVENPAIPEEYYERDEKCSRVAAKTREEELENA